MTTPDEIIYEACGNATREFIHNITHVVTRNATIGVVETGTRIIAYRETYYFLLHATHDFCQNMLEAENDTTKEL